MKEEFKNQSKKGDEPLIIPVFEEISEDQLLEEVDFDRIPQHIAIIMDGNRRWAESRGMPGFMGHSHGVEAFRRVLTACCELGVKVLSVYAFSMENWRRTQKEVRILMDIFKFYCKKEKQLMFDTGVQFRVVGKRDDLDPELQNIFQEVEEYTKDRNRIRLNLCINYGSRYEITQACLQLHRDLEEGVIEPEEVDENTLSRYMYTAGQPDPDLMIRTSGELRISNFLLWQSAYTEFWFTPLYWPDMDKRILLLAIRDFQQRDRRFGGGKLKIDNPPQDNK